MQFTEFYITPKKRIKGWRRRNKDGNLIPYKVIAMDIEYVGVHKQDPFEDPKIQAGMSMGMIDEEDIVEMELENEKANKSTESVICWILVGNHINNTFKWFNIEDVRYCNLSNIS